MSEWEGIPQGLIEVAPPGMVTACAGGRMALRTVEAQNARLFDAAKPGKGARFRNVLRRAGGGPKEEGDWGGDEEVLLPRKTVLVPAADETVRTTLKPWLRDAWKIKGEISSITEATGEETAAEILKDVFDNAACARSAARHLYSPFVTLRPEGMHRDLLDLAERERVTAFALALEDRLKSVNVNDDFFQGAQVADVRENVDLLLVGAIDALKTLEVVKDVLLGLVEITKPENREDFESGSIVGLTEMHIDHGRGARVAAFLAAVQESRHWGLARFGQQQPSLAEVVLRICNCTFIWNKKGEEPEIFKAEFQKRETQKDTPPTWKEEVVLLAEFAAKGICDIRSYGNLKYNGDSFDGRLTLTYDGMAVAIIDGLTAPGLFRFDLQCSVYLVYGLQQAVASQDDVSPPQAYHLHPVLNSVTTYPGCALKPFCDRCLVGDCHDKLRRIALKSRHRTLFVLAAGLVIILNFKTSNACIITLKYVPEGASTDAGPVKLVSDLLQNEKVEGEMEIDRTQAMQQLSAARDVCAAQGTDPGELVEWEGTAMVSAATWLQSTYLMRVGNRWYIRQNPRWKRIWRLVIRFVREHRLTGISVLSAGVTWNTVVVKDVKIVQLLCDKMLGATRTAQKGWYEVSGSRDIEGIVRATAGDVLHIDDNVLRLCRSTIEGSIAQSQRILLSVYGGFSNWRYLYAREQSAQDASPMAFDYMARDPHQLGGRSLMKMEAGDGCYIKLRNDAGLLNQRWYKLRNSPDSPVLDLDGHFKDGDNLTDDERRSVSIFDDANRIVSIGAGTLSG